LVEGFQENELNILIDVRAPIYLSKNQKSQQWSIFKNSQEPQRKQDLFCHRSITELSEAGYFRYSEDIGRVWEYLADDVTIAVTATEQTTVTPGVVYSTSYR
jgi:hypothetical protein